MAKLSLVVCVAVLCSMVVVAPHAEAAMTCGKVASSLGSCLTYLKGTGPLIGGCCNGVKGLVAAAKTTADRQTACGCLKSMATSISGLKPNLASSLPGKCGVKVGYPISTSTDCSKSIRSEHIRAMANLSLVIAVLCMVVVAPHAEAAINCGTVAGSLGGCFNYITGKGQLTPGCCAGVKKLAAAAKTTADRQTACGCLKSLAGKLPGLKPNLAAGIPGKCGVNVGYPISTSTDCSKYA
nr:non-specific lipid-transfer protein 1-like [Ipomoea batatas]